MLQVLGFARCLGRVLKQDEVNCLTQDSFSGCLVDLTPKSFVWDLSRRPLQGATVMQPTRHGCSVALRDVIHFEDSPTANSSVLLNQARFEPFSTSTPSPIELSHHVRFVLVGKSRTSSVPP